MWQMKNEEFNAVITLPAPKRYSYFVKKVADWEQVWILGAEDNTVIVTDNLGRELIPFWPHPRFAQACAVGPRSGEKASTIEVHLWLEYWVPGMIRDKRLAAIFPTPMGQGVPIAVERLKVDLEEELAKME